MRAFIKFTSLFALSLLMFYACENQNPMDSTGDEISATLESETLIQEPVVPECMILPEGIVIQSAVLHLYCQARNYQDIYVYKIIDNDWIENEVTWNNFGASYLSAPSYGAFNANAYGYLTVDITALVQEWINGVPNFGLLLDQTDKNWPRAQFGSRESASYKPYLVVTYGNGPMEEKSFPIADAYIWEVLPDYNTGSSELLYTGWGNATDLEKQSLIKFCFEFIPDEFENPGTGTPGYWKNHPEAWPVEEITIGGISYSKEDAISYMKKPVKKDKTFTMFPALVCAKLNVMIGNDDSCIEDTIMDADAWMAANPVGSGVAGSSKAWKMGEPLYLEMDAYNNGLLCAPHRD